MILQAKSGSVVIINVCATQSWKKTNRDELSISLSTYYVLSSLIIYLLIIIIEYTTTLIPTSSLQHVISCIVCFPKHLPALQFAMSRTLLILWYRYRTCRDLVCTSNVVTLSFEHRIEAISILISSGRTRQRKYSILKKKPFIRKCPPSDEGSKVRDHPSICLHFYCHGG